MKIKTEYLRLQTRGDAEMIDITDEVQSLLTRNGFNEGNVTLFVPGSTGALTTIEYEPGLLKDFPMILERIAPKNIEYEHHKRWGDYNGHSHVRATLIKSSFTVPISDGKLILGTWQQIVFIELDVRPRRRKIIVTVIGE